MGSSESARDLDGAVTLCPASGDGSGVRARDKAPSPPAASGREGSQTPNAAEGPRLGIEARNAPHTNVSGPAEAAESHQRALPAGAPHDVRLTDCDGRLLYASSTASSVAEALAEATVRTRGLRDPGPGVTRGVDVAGCDLSGCSYAGGALEGANLSGATASRADLSGADLTGARLSSARLTRCVLRGARLERACGTGMEVTDSDLGHVSASESQLDDTLFERCLLAGTQCAGCSFRAAELVATRARRAAFRFCDFTGTALRRASFRDSLFEDCRFEGAVLKTVLFENCRFERCVFDGVSGAKVGFEGPQTRIRRCSFRNCQMIDGRFAGAQFIETRFLGSSILRTDFTGAVFRRHCELRRSYFTGGRFREADLADVSVRHSGFKSVDFSHADLSQVAFILCDLRGTELDGAKLPHFQIVPDEGAFIGYKRLAGGTICKLLIPEDAERTGNMVDRKCRASHAVVLDGEGTSFNADLGRTPLAYRKGETVAAPDYTDDFRTSAGGGVHFFLTRREAEEYIEGGESPIAGWGALPTLGG